MIRWNIDTEIKCHKQYFQPKTLSFTIPCIVVVP